MMVQHYAGRVLVAMGGGKSREVKVGESLKESSREKQLTSVDRQSIQDFKTKSKENFEPLDGIPS